MRILFIYKIADISFISLRDLKGIMVRSTNFHFHSNKLPFKA